MKRPKGQAGFSIVSVLAVIVVSGIIGVTGWFVYQHNRIKPTSALGTPNQLGTQQTTTPAAPSPTVSYLTVKEWGIKLPLPASIKDANYIVSTSFGNDPDGLPSGVWLGLESLTD